MSRPKRLTQQIMHPLKQLRPLPVGLFEYDAPLISIVICTYNGERLITDCVESILRQDYSCYEILFVDGGSFDRTKQIIEGYIRKHAAWKLISNPNRLPEGIGNGKWLGFSKSSGDIVAFIDQDNVLQRNDLFSSTIFRLNNGNIMGLAGGLTNDLSDDIVVRYVSLFGTDSFFAYRSLDFIVNLRYSHSDYRELIIDRACSLLAGGNCFFYRKKDLLDIGGYSRDVLAIKALLHKYPAIGVIPNATKHYAEQSIGALIRKKFKWGTTYFAANNDNFEYLPKARKERLSFLVNLFFNLTIIFNLYYSIRIYINRKDPVSFLYPLISFANTLAYGINSLRLNALFTRLSLSSSRAHRK